MAKGILHLHLSVVLIFLIFFAFKTILLLINSHNLLDKIREKTKVLEMILGTLILLSGGYLMYVTKNTDIYIIGKIILVMLAIPLGIVGLKKKNKVLAVLSLLIFIYVYGVAETKSLKFKRDKFVLSAATETSVDSASEAIMEANQDAGLNNAKAVYSALCVSCHGPDGKLGVANAKDLSQSVLPDEEKKKIIAKGKGLMRGFKNELSEQEIDLMVRYVNTFKKQ